MIERDELVYVVMGVLYGLTTPGMVNKILDAVEPLIRDDEDERIAQAIEAMPYWPHAAGERLVRRDTAVRLARNGGGYE